MKKLISALLCSAMFLTFCACSSETVAPNDEKTNEKVTVPESENDGDGYVINDDECIGTENFKVNLPMLIFYYVNDFYTTYNQMGYYFSMMGFDVTKDFSAQWYDDTQSWYNYFVNYTAKGVKYYTAFAEAAKEDGFEYDELDASVDEYITQVEDYAKELGMSLDDYIVKVFSDKVTVEDIKAAVRLQIYAGKYYEKLQTGITDGITEEKIEEYYNDNKKIIDRIDFISYSVADKTQADIFYTAAKEGEEAFKNAVSQYITVQNTQKEEPLDADALAAETETALMLKSGQSYTENDEFLEWAFGDDAKAGEVYYGEDTSGNYTVYILKAAPYTPDDYTVDIRHILIKSEGLSDEEAQAKAQAVLDEWKAGEATAESFEELAQQYNDDSNCLYENVTQGKMVQTFNDWIFDETRETGDSDIVKTEYGYHVMLFGGKGDAVWKKEAKDTLANSEISELSAQIQEKYEDSYIVNDDLLLQLPTVMPENADAQEEAANNKETDNAETSDTDAPVTEEVNG